MTSLKRVIDDANIVSAAAASSTSTSKRSRLNGGDNDASHRSVYWNDERKHLMLIDQRKLPLTLAHITCTTVDEVAAAIKTMVVRGAPAIGAAGGFGMAIAALEVKSEDTHEFLAHLQAAKGALDKARPTAVNLSWATDRLLQLVSLCVQKGHMSVEELTDAVMNEANDLAEEDVRINRSLGAQGAVLVSPGQNILHHCNTGCLATVDYGTALGVIYACHEQGKNIHVWVDETRPRLQGARLTAWELMRAGVKMHLIADSASGHLMRCGKVDIVFFGADRVAANGDVANKIGSYNLSTVARENGVPVYACVPTPTIDLTMVSGDSIDIEERDASEVTHIQEKQIAPSGVPVYNPAFDVTPFKYVTGIITEEGICYPPYTVSLRAAKQRAEKRIHSHWRTTLRKYGIELEKEF